MHNEETYQQMRGGKGPKVYLTVSGMMTRRINSIPTQHVDAKSLFMIVLFKSCPYCSYHIMPYKAKIIKGAETMAKVTVNIFDK